MPRAGAIPINSSGPGGNLFLNGDTQQAQRTGGNTTTTTTSDVYYTDRFTQSHFQASTPTTSRSTLPDIPDFTAIGGKSDRAMRHNGTCIDGTANVSRFQAIESIRHKKMNGNIISVGTKLWTLNFQEVRILVQQPDVADTYGAVTVISDTVIPVDDSAWTLVKSENLTLVNENGIRVFFILQNPSDTTGVFNTYTTEFMCNEGTFLEPFKLFAKDADEEVRYLQRYFEKSHPLDTVLNTTNLTGAFSEKIVIATARKYIHYQTRKRTIGAVVTFYNPENAGAVGTWRDASGATNRAVAAATGSGDKSIAVSITAPTTGTFMRGHWASDAEI